MSAADTASPACASLPLRAVLFDLDGTLADTAPDLIAAANRILVEEGRAPLPDAALRPLVSKGGRALLARAFPELDDAAREPLLPRFLAAYADALAVHTRPFDGIEPLLRDIEARGWLWGIVTNKPEGLAVGVVEGLGWSTRSKALVGGDTLAVRKPAPEPLLHAAAQLGVAPSQCLYVGDDARDIEAAKAAGMPSAAALWGYREAHENPRDWLADVDCLDAAALQAWLTGQGG
jgi:phosphoglycolate phosphatase